MELTYVEKLIARKSYQYLYSSLASKVQPNQDRRLFHQAAQSGADEWPTNMFGKKQAAFFFRFCLGGKPEHHRSKAVVGTTDLFGACRPGAKAGHHVGLVWRWGP